MATLKSLPQPASEERAAVRLAGLPDSYYLGDAKTVAGECVGQGVVVSTISQIIAVNFGLSKGDSAASLAPTPEQAVVIELADQMNLFCSAA